MISTNQFKNGMAIEIDGEPFSIVEFQHVKPGKGGAFVRTKVKSLSSGGLLDKTFRAGEKFKRIHTTTRPFVYLYAAGDEVVLMDNENYEQITMPLSSISDGLDLLSPNKEVEVFFIDSSPVAINLPTFVELKVAQTAPGAKGDTVGQATKEAVLETGAYIQVPLFVEEGNVLKIDTRTKSYVTRI